VHIIAREERFNYDGTLVQGSGTTSEIWSASDPLRFHVREATRHHSTWDSAYVDGVVTTRDSKDGKIRSTRLDEAGRRATEDMDNDTGLTQPGRDPIPVIRRLLADGELEHAGSSELDGRKVERLVGSTPAGDDGTPREDVEYLVDAETYAPVRLATKGTLKDGRPAGSFKLTFKRYERLPLTAENEKLLVVR
jgi:hypothetical protein